MSLLRWVPLPVLAEAEARSWGRGFQWWPCPLHTTQQWCLASVVVGASSTNFLSCGALTRVPSDCLFTANSCPLPGSTFQTPLSSTQPPSATGDTQPRLRCAGLQLRLCVQFLLCSAFHRPATAFPSDLSKVSFCPS